MSDTKSIESKDSLSSLLVAVYCRARLESANHYKGDIGTFTLRNSLHAPSIAYSSSSPMKPRLGHDQGLRASTSVQAYPYIVRQ